MGCQLTHCDRFQTFFSKMSKMSMTKLLKKRCILDMPYEILFEIFRRLPSKGKLIEISRLCLKFRDVAGDPRFWRDVIIRYDETVFAFEELYSEPWPVDVINLQQTQIEPPVSAKTDQVVKVTKLCLSEIKADKVTLEAMLAKYQCTELCLDYNTVDLQGRIEGIAPEAFSKQTALEVLSLRCFKLHFFDSEITETTIQLAPILSNCKNLKTLYFCTALTNLDFSDFFKNVPTSLERLFLKNVGHKDSFFKLLVESAPNLKELGLCPDACVRCPSLAKFEFLEILHLVPCRYPYYDICISDLHLYLIKYPALKTVDICCDPMVNSDTDLGKLQTRLKPRGISVRKIGYSDNWFWSYANERVKGGDLWKVSKTM